MIERTLYQFEFVTGDDERRNEVANLTQCLQKLLPDADVYWESAKSDIAVLRIETEVHQ